MTAATMERNQSLSKSGIWLSRIWNAPKISMNGLLETCTVHAAMSTGDEREVLCFVCFDRE